MSEFKILFLYPNGTLMNPPAIAIGIFTALLKQNGFEVDLFDTTLYPDIDPDAKILDDEKEDSLQARPTNYEDRGVKLLTSDMLSDLAKKVDEFKPDLIAVSLLESIYPIALTMFEVIETYEIPVLVGGVFAMHAPEVVIENKCIDMVCIGEGEETIVEVCKRLALNKDCYEVDNLWIKKDDKIIKNKLKNTINVNEIPIPDYSLFEWERFMRPMGGKIYNTIPVESNRGCPYLCTFCNSPSTFDLFKQNESSSFFRKKTIKTIHKELISLKNQWNAEYVYFTSDTFLILTKDELNELADLYVRDINLPFWIQTRAETITPFRVKKLKEMGCHRISIGLEHGNEEFRRKILKKTFSDKTIINAVNLIADAGIPLTVNNIIGFPEENRDLVFDTIALNRKLIVDTTNCVAFAPFRGTPLHKICVEKGYIEADQLGFGSMTTSLFLDLPTFPKEEIQGLRRTFSLYVRMPKKYWPDIERAEKLDEDGDKIFSELSNIFMENYFSVQGDGFDLM